MVWSKKIATVFFLFIAINISAQSDVAAPSWKEIFKQKKTQLSYLYQFIVTHGAKLYIMKEGRSVSNDKLGNINLEKQGSFEGDLSYINDLSEVPNILLESSQLTTIVRNQSSILELINKTYDVLQNNQEIIPEQTSKIYKDLLKSLEEKVSEDMTELELIVLKNELKFTDDQRLNRLIALSEESGFKKEYAQMIYDRTIIFVNYIISEQKNINETEQYNGKN